MFALAATSHHASMDTTRGSMRVTSGKGRVRESRLPGSVRAEPNGRATRPRPMDFEASKEEQDFLLEYDLPASCHPTCLDKVSCLNPRLRHGSIAIRLHGDAHSSGHHVVARQEIGKRGGFLDCCHASRRECSRMINVR